MKEKTLLMEIKEEQQKILEEKFAQAEEEKIELAKEKALKSGIQAFSSASYPEVKKEEEEVTKLESKVSSVIEKPNYDYIESLSQVEKEKIFKIVKEEDIKPKAKPSRIKFAVLGILLAIFGVWGIVNIATLSSVNSSLSKVEYEYGLKLTDYIKSLISLDTTSESNMNNLLPTIPEQGEGATNIAPHSNWFDRFCNFIGGLFGG